jgi:hypothetical protein
MAVVALGAVHVSGRVARVEDRVRLDPIDRGPMLPASWINAGDQTQALDDPQRPADCSLSAVRTRGQRRHGGISEQRPARRVCQQMLKDGLRGLVAKAEIAHREHQVQKLRVARIGAHCQALRLELDGVGRLRLAAIALVRRRGSRPLLLAGAFMHALRGDALRQRLPGWEGGAGLPRGGVLAGWCGPTRSRRVGGLLARGRASPRWRLAGPLAACAATPTPPQDRSEDGRDRLLDTARGPDAEHMAAVGMREAPARIIAAAGGLLHRGGGVAQRGDFRVDVERSHFGSGRRLTR